MDLESHGKILTVIRLNVAGRWGPAVCRLLWERPPAANAGGTGQKPGITAIRGQARSHGAPTKTVPLHQGHSNLRGHHPGTGIQSQKARQNASCGAARHEGPPGSGGDRSTLVGAGLPANRCVSSAWGIGAAAFAGRPAPTGGMSGPI
ncbi:diguanylate cyclase [Ectothiorhodospira haloalkaliphila]|uniref:Diguanylate cyclase n=1 Tax=Ectothiorhodospira haloalkaliphila TaxID=421628 RepID=W8KRU4_9GAMM|nr:diguanylate cyclase [Ectothiorhodospira haloalkaliphila]